MRKTILGAVLALFLPSCGGGGGTEATLEAAALEGVVYEVDGQTVDRSDIVVRVLETGEVFVTDTDGSFRFEDLAPGRYTLDFDSSLRALMSAEHDGEHDEEIPEREHDGDEGVPDEHDGDGEHDEPREEHDGEEAREEREHEEGEDREGRPVIEVTEECGRIEIRIALEDGRVREFTIDEHVSRHAKGRLEAPGDLDTELHGRVNLTSLEGRQIFKVVVAELVPGVVVELFLDDREGGGAVSIGTAVADAFGRATYQRDTGEGQELPLGALILEELAGHRIEVRLAATDTLVLVGEVPDLPDPADHRCDDEREDGEGEGEERDEEPRDEPDGEHDGETDEPHDGSSRGKALLLSEDRELEGHVAIRCWPAEEIQRFRMDIAGLQAGDRVAFEIESEGAWSLLAIREANGDGFAVIDTDEDLAMPLGVPSVRELVGLRVRIRRAEEGNDDVLLAGRVPELVRD